LALPQGGACEAPVSVASRRPLSGRLRTLMVYLAQGPWRGSWTLQAGRVRIVAIPSLLHRPGWLAHMSRPQG